jgi:hypothetical protein
LQSLVDEESGALGDLLSDLLGYAKLGAASCARSLLTLNGVCELWAESDVGDRDIVKDQVETPCAAHQVFSNESGNHLSLSDNLTGVELCNDTLQDLVHDRRQYALVVVCSELTVTDGVSRSL